jgi:GTP-binding protein
VVNKTDGLDEAACVNEFARFGVERILPIAAAHQRGIPQLLEAMLPRLPKDEDRSARRTRRWSRARGLHRPTERRKVHLVNRLLGEERMIASDVPGTTRDSISVDLERDGRHYR